MNFLSNILREEGGFEYKKAIVDSVLCLIQDIPEAKESGLAHLSEFIEDCEFTYLSSQILHVLGNEGPKTVDPSKYIRYIYNRVILENATIRASAVCALAKFGTACQYLRPRIITLLQRCLYDNDDEVRDRATYFVAALKKEDDTSNLMESCSANMLTALEVSLRAYTTATANMPFSIESVEVTPGLESTTLMHKGVAPAQRTPSQHISTFSQSLDKEINQAQDMILRMPEFAEYGPIFKVFDL